MNDMDYGVLDILGPQLMRGKLVELTKAKNAALAAWAVKYVLMNQLTHDRERRFAIPEPGCARFYAERSPDSAMRLWAGYMEPPGKHGGLVLGIADFSLNETYHDPSMLARAGLSVDLVSKEFSAVFRFGHCVISLYRANDSILEAIRLIRALAPGCRFGRRSGRRGGRRSNRYFHYRRAGLTSCSLVWRFTVRSHDLLDANSGRGGSPHSWNWRRGGAAIATRLRGGGRARIQGCRFLNAETQSINVPGMPFLPADGVLPAKVRDEGLKL